ALYEIALPFFLMRPQLTYDGRPGLGLKRLSIHRLRVVRLEPADRDLLDHQYLQRRWIGPAEQPSPCYHLFASRLGKQHVVAGVKRQPEVSSNLGDVAEVIHDLRVDLYHLLHLWQHGLVTGLGASDQVSQVLVQLVRGSAHDAISFNNEVTIGHHTNSPQQEQRPVAQTI